MQYSVKARLELANALDVRAKVQQTLAPSELDYLDRAISRVTSALERNADGEIYDATVALQDAVFHVEFSMHLGQ